MTTKNAVFWDVTPCGSCYKKFVLAFRRHSASEMCIYTKFAFKKKTKNGSRVTRVLKDNSQVEAKTTLKTDVIVSDSVAPGISKRQAPSSDPYIRHVSRP
jgi:hypothetical protein